MGADSASGIAARLGSGPRKARSRALTVTTTMTTLTLGGGGYRLYGSAVGVYYATRAANADGSMVSTEGTAPVAATLVASVKGTPDGSFAFGNGFAGTSSDGAGVAGTCAVGALALPTDVTQWREISIPTGGYVNLYLLGAGATSPILEGPFE